MLLSEIVGLGIISEFFPFDQGKIPGLWSFYEVLVYGPEKLRYPLSNTQISTFLQHFLHLTYSDVLQ